MHSKCFVCRNHQPVEQCWFLEPGVSAKRGTNPITAQEHLASNLCVAWFVWTNEWEMTETEEVESEKDYGNQKLESLGKR
jgi:hypothetical protein